MRKHYIDNIRWLTVVLVLIYHVFYLYNAVGVLGGVGSFSAVQYQDGFLYFVYPWFICIVRKMQSLGGFIAFSASLGSGADSQYTYHYNLPVWHLFHCVFNWVFFAFSRCRARKNTKNPFADAFACPGDGHYLYPLLLWPKLHRRSGFEKHFH